MNRKIFRKPYRFRFGSCKLEFAAERQWEQSFLRDKCKDLNLEEEYKKYQIRLMVSYLTVFILLFLLVVTCNNLILYYGIEYFESAYIDIICDVTTFALVAGILAVNFVESFVFRHSWVMLCSSVLSAYIVVICDITQNMYHYYHSSWPLNTSYDVFALCMIYMFLPIPSIKAAALLAFSVSVIYIFYFLHFIPFGQKAMASPVRGLELITVEVVHYLGFNMMGIFFRIFNDTIVRASFLDRYQFIKEEIWLRHALRQESTILDSILPPQIAKPIQTSIKEKIMKSDSDYDTFDFGRRKRESLVTFQIHPDVSILYADVVNYTHLTTTLTVENLVKVLHDLYGRFDMAASFFKVQRIKFLGDCYYCVAGLAGADPDHAKMAVSLGISMIANIQEVRLQRSLNIDMRIGVHSGSLISGVIGKAKLQFDIWGADVDIANRLEATGKPGYVHVSGRTLSHLDPKDYTIFSGTEKAKLDPVLQKNPMSTYLLTAAPNRDSFKSLKEFRSYGSMEFKTLETERRTQVVADGSISEELRDGFDKMPVGGIKCRSACCRRDTDTNKEKSNRDLGIFCVAFKNSSLEWNYLHQPDYLFKYSIMLAWGVGCCLIYAQTVTTKIACNECIIIDLIAFVLLTSMLCIAWYKKVCWWLYDKYSPRKYGKCSCFIFYIFEKIQHSFVLRIVVYMTVLACYFMVICLIVVTCDQSQFQLDWIDSKLFHYELDRETCFHPWVFTNMMALILATSYTFARIPFALKTIIACLEALAHLLIVYFQYRFVFHHSLTTTPHLSAEFAHFIRVSMMLITMYAKERQSEFNTKMNYKLNVDLQNKQKAADVTNQSIIILLNNILPSHVVDVYLSSVAKHELYCENYRKVSVMFAMIMNFRMDIKSLRVINDIITEFDKLLIAYREYYVVEKIKVVGCTYMAACGLDINLASKIRDSTFVSSSSASTDLERFSSLRYSSDRTNNRDEVAFIMTSFALDLMRVMSACNTAYKTKPFDRALSSGELCIGISTGEIMAGVVGASQPHYDIWGNPVNMASRMESTGLPGHIQVTEESAKILEEFDIQCDYRGLTFVKGRGEIPTYFVGIDKDLKFIAKNSPQSSARHSIHASEIILYGKNYEE
ncbi:LOW QUALITY PROTEIN: adenylyl cyclase X E-like [Drosophila eugracilis]|uniref:LOW QUALITY PROTEIN: adenylyl cyclase X E-like n=1 Tax=Drosophila eugracilis TaxID=29029 RepID=UPI001BDA1136|nr:LOW QUALITY PROTEIN: adenylyl cyclase X E-like [Drosophila eugracilis]